MTKKSEGEMNNMVTIWVVDDAVMDNAVERLVYNLANFNQVGLVTLQRAVMVQAEPAWADLLLKCLEASGLKMVVERALVVDEPLAGLGEAVQAGAGDPAMGPVVLMPLCEVCGEAFEPRKKGSRICDKPECKKERARRYAREYAREHPKPSKKFPVSEVVKEDMPVYKEGEPNALWPYKVIDGEDAGRLVTVDTMELWLKISRLPAGTMVEHFERGRYMVDKKDGGKKGMTLRKVAKA